MFALLSALRSYKTTAFGVLVAVGMLIGEAKAVLDEDPKTVINWEQVTIALGALGIGVFARDSDVTSEKAGAK